MNVRIPLLAAGAAAAALFAAVQMSVAQNPADDDVVLKAMRDEMARSKQLSAINGQDPAYFFSYDLTDSETLTVRATLGSSYVVSRDHQRIPSIEVRVGTYDFDNTDHVASGRSSGARLDGGWPLDDNYNALRECFWLATDFAYKSAIESMGRKRASLKNAAGAPDSLPDFAKTDPVVSLPKVGHRKIDDDQWAGRVAKLSGAFSTVPEVINSAVDLQVIDGITELVNSEGTAIRYNDRVNLLTAQAEGQAPDGMLIHDALAIQSLDLDKLPSEADMRKSVSDVADHIRALVHAPMGEDYTGPVLFEPAAGAQLLAQLVGDNLRIPRKPLADPGARVNFNPGEFESKIGSRVLPDWFDVTDDPTQAAWNGKPLIGFYEFDLEGVRPKPVPVIQKGVLKSFLTTRQPIKGFPASNGHARLTGNYGASGAAISNLIFKANQTMPMADLKKRLIDMTQEQGKPYGILVRKLDFPFSQGVGEYQALAQASAQSGGSARPVSPPLLIYKVYKDGREELVRGMRFRGMSTRSLRDIDAASQESALFDYVNNGAPMAIMGVGGYLSATAVISPGLLFDELELEHPQEQLPKIPVVPPPGAAQ
jgi:predicted Zn-dependent protease